MGERLDGRIVWILLVINILSKRWAAFPRRSARQPAMLVSRSATLGKAMIAAEESKVRFEHVRWSPGRRHDDAAARATPDTEAPDHRRAWSSPVQRPLASEGAETFPVQRRSFRLPPSRARPLPPDDSNGWKRAVCPRGRLGHHPVLAQLAGPFPPLFAQRRLPDAKPSPVVSH